MLLRNYWEIKRCQSTCVFKNNTQAPWGAPTTMKAVDGTVFSNFPYIDGYNWYGNNSSYSNYNSGQRKILNPFNGLVLKVGTGTTDPAITDYSIETDVTSSFSSVSTNTTYSVNEDNHFVCTITWTGTNTSGADITITEVGGVVSCADLSSTTDPSNTNTTLRSVLMFRQILVTPVVVSAGNTASITIQIEMS